MDGIGVHHIHRRKRIHEKKEEYPHPNKWIRWFDRFLFIVAVLGPLMTIPQIIKLYSLQNAASFSMFTWAFLCMGNVPWIIYGIIHKARPVLVSYLLWFVANLTIVIGIILYG